MERANRLWRRLSAMRHMIRGLAIRLTDLEGARMRHEDEIKQLWIHIDELAKATAEDTDERDSVYDTLAARVERNQRAIEAIRGIEAARSRARQLPEGRVASGGGSAP